MERRCLHPATEQVVTSHEQAAEDFVRAFFEPPWREPASEFDA